MDKKFTYKQSNGRVTFRRGAFPEYTDEHLNRLETENEPVAAILNALNEFEKKNTPRPVFVAAHSNRTGECSNCGSFTCVMDDEHYCQSCGQLLSGTMLKKSYDIEISRDYIFVTDKRTGERKEVDISRACNVSEMIRAAESTLENLIIDFLNAEAQFNGEKQSTRRKAARRTAAMNKVLLSSNKDDWCTPQALFEELDREFHFDLDAAASNDNAKCKRYFTKETDGLHNSWGGGYGILQSPLWA